MLFEFQYRFFSYSFRRNDNHAETVNNNNGQKPMLEHKTFKIEIFIREEFVI